MLGNISVYFLYISPDKLDQQRQCKWIMSRLMVCGGNQAAAHNLRTLTAFLWFSNTIMFITTTLCLRVSDGVAFSGHLLSFDSFSLSDEPWHNNLVQDGSDY